MNYYKIAKKYIEYKERFIMLETFPEFANITRTQHILFVNFIRNRYEFISTENVMKYLKEEQKKYIKSKL